MANANRDKTLIRFQGVDLEDPRIARVNFKVSRWKYGGGYEVEIGVIPIDIELVGGAAGIGRATKEAAEQLAADLGEVVGMLSEWPGS